MAIVHNQRHPCITDELRLGETYNKTIAETTGHSQISTALDIYATSTTEMKRAAAGRRQAAYDRQERS